MTRDARNGDPDVSSTSWVYRWNPNEKNGNRDGYFHSLDHASWNNPTIFNYHDEFLQKQQKSANDPNGRHMATVIPWLMSLSLISAQTLRPYLRTEELSQSLLPPEVPAGYYDAPFQKLTGENVAFRNLEPCDDPHAESNVVRSPDQGGESYVGIGSLRAKTQQDYRDGESLRPFPNAIDQNAVGLLPNSDLRNGNNRGEHYKTTHKYLPPVHTGNTDEYAGPAMEQVYSWVTVDFEFKSAESRQSFMANGSYNPENALPLGLEVWRDKIFLTLPKWKEGIPVTLATVPRYSRQKSPKLRPYPSWDWHEPGNCDALTSVFRVQVDECNRLWVLDSGQVQIMTAPLQICPPQVLVFDLKTDKLLRRYKLPEEQIKQDSLYSNIAVDVRDGVCDRAVAYLADVWRFGISVYDFFENESFRIQHHFFFPDPLSSRYDLHGLNFQWTDGLFGLCLSPVDVNGDRTLFFHPMSSFREFAVPTSILRDESTAEENSESFIPIGKPRAEHSGHSSGSAMDRNGVMFFNMVTRDSVWCWDSRKEYIPQNLGVVGQSNVSLIFPNDIKIDHDNDQNMWVLSNKLPMYLYGHLDSTEVNYRLFKANVKEAIQNTVCDPNYVVPPSENGYDVTC